MTEALPDALTIPPDAPLVQMDLPDPHDIHVVAAAAHSQCDTLLTFNLKDFPDDLLKTIEPPVVAVHPDAFLLKLLTTRAPTVLNVIERVRQNLTNPPMSGAHYADALVRTGLPRTAELLRYVLPSSPA